MQIDTGIVCLCLGAVLALQGWTLREIVRLKTRVAIMTALWNAEHGKKQQELDL